ncbi:MAG: hypothetical protein GX981_10610 [Tissierellia bacterium]|nr:hypothetical protein [Tissierellia bacterium]
MSESYERISKSRLNELLAKEQELKERKDYEVAKTCRIDYEQEYFRQQEHMQQLINENKKLKTALINLALKI